MYGFWWRLLEIIALQMDASDRTSCEYSDKVWGSFTGISPKKFKKYAGILEEKKLISMKNGNKNITINVPNILKYRDEYTRKESNKK